MVIHVISCNFFGVIYSLKTKTSKTDVTESASSIKLISSVGYWSCHLYLKPCPFYDPLRKLHQIICLCFLDTYWNRRFYCRVFFFFFGLFISLLWMMLFLYLLISNSLMNKLDNGNRQKNQVRVCPWPSSVSHVINKLIIETWEWPAPFI